MWDFTKQYRFDIKINDRVVDEYPHTDGNTYIEGRPGSEYTIDIWNTSYEEICAIPAVDGLSVFDGKEAGLDSRGYIVSPKGYISIPGWTLNTNQVAKFEFGDVKSSYAAQTGKSSANIGVIGVMVFRPKPKRYPDPVFRHATLSDSGWGLEQSASKGMTYDSFDASGHMGDAASLSSVPQEMGTGFGGVKDFNTREVKFEKRDRQNPDAIMALYYDSARGLERRGIRVGQKHNPSPFPTYVNNTVGCTPPPGWVKK